MIHFLIATFMVLHGAVHAIMFGLPLIPKVKAELAADGVFPSDSWLIGEKPVFAFVFALGVALAFLVAGAAFQWRATWGPSVTLGAAGAPLSIALAIAAWRAQTAAAE